MKCITFVNLLVIVVAYACAHVNLPNYITPCKTKDSECLKIALKKLGPHLKEGISEFNLQSVDPLSIPDHKQTDETSPDMPYLGNFVNIQYTGASNFEVSEFNIDLDSLKFNLVIYFPKLIMSAYEIVRINALGYNLDGEWPVKETYKNVTISFSLSGTKHSGEYIKWSEEQIKASFEEGSYDVDTSYRDGQDYQAFLNKASREYPDLFDPEIELYIKETIGYFIVESLNAVHEIFPIDVLYQLS